MGSVIDQLGELKLSYLRTTGADPERIMLGREMADRLADEVMAIHMVPAWALELPAEKHREEFIRQLEAGQVFMFGTRLEAGWLNG